MFLDLTKYKCPITFVKAKIALEKLKNKDVLVIKIMILLSNIQLVNV